MEEEILKAYEQLKEEPITLEELIELLKDDKPLPLGNYKIV